MPYRQPAAAQRYATEPIINILKDPLERAAAALFFAVLVLGVALGVLFAVASSSAAEFVPRATPAENTAVSTMLRGSGFAIAKDKLD